MANRRVSVWKYVKIGGSWRYKAAAYGANGKIKPDVVIVDGTHQYHPEGNYYLRLSAGGGSWRKIGPKAGDATRAAEWEESMLSAKAMGTRSQSLLPQRGVGVDGFWASDDAGSCSNNGSRTAFAGTTESHGVYSCPDCKVHAVWNLTANYNTVVGACQPPGSLQQLPVDFPCGGAIQPFQCNL